MLQTTLIQLSRLQSGRSHTLSMLLPQTWLSLDHHNDRSWETCLWQYTSSKDLLISPCHLQWQQALSTLNHRHHHTFFTDKVDASTKAKLIPHLATVCQIYDRHYLSGTGQIHSEYPSGWPNFPPLVAWKMASLPVWWDLKSWLFQTSFHPFICVQQD